VKATATGHFELVWDEEPAYDDAKGAALAKVTLTKEFHGDIVGTSSTQLIKAMSERDDSAGYVAIERVTGSLHGRSGTFVLQHSALMDRGKGDLRIVVVPDTATGDLTGLRGGVHIDITDGMHKYTFDYTLDEDGEETGA
jgi:hypothetical protein